MNIVYIHTHDTGRYIEPYGYNVPTPNLMELAETGTLFRQAFSAAPTCSPSRAGLLTGMSPHSNGMLGLAHRGFELDDYNKHLVNFLKDYDFETILCGMQHVAPEAEMIGYDKILDDQPEAWGVETDKENAELVADYIKSQNQEPFFLSYGMECTHLEFPEIDDEIDKNYVMPPATLPDNEETRKDMAGFITSAKIADYCVGTVLDALSEAGIRDDTLIIYTTDHGLPFPKMKSTLYDDGTGVSLIMNFPNDLAQGEAVDALVSQLDIFPTICDLLEFNQPEWLQGQSLLPLLKNKKEQIREEIFTEVTFHAAYEPMRAVRTKRYKYIRFYDNHNQIVAANIDDCNSKDFLLEHDYLELEKEKEMLFDLYFDPMEQVNLVDNDRYQEVYQGLKEKLDNWMKETDDPLLDGKVEKPAGAKINKLSCLSAEIDDFEE